jgi:formylmethanofuran dehydrogenase subunit E
MRVLAVAVSLALLAGIAGCVFAKQRSAASEMGPGREEVTWYYFDWMASAPYAPDFKVLDTESSLGPYADKAKTITLKDLTKMHGHPCDGLVTAACALYVGFSRIFPEGVIDRTDTACITNNSPCFGDVAAYLTGGRIRFGTQKIDPGLGSEFILVRLSTGQAVKVELKHGLFSEEVHTLERNIRKGEFTVDDMRRCQRLQWDFARRLLNRPLDESSTVKELENFVWEPDPFIHQGKRGDVINKGILRRQGNP